MPLFELPLCFSFSFLPQQQEKAERTKKNSVGPRKHSPTHSLEHHHHQHRTIRDVPGNSGDIRCRFQPTITSAHVLLHRIVRHGTTARAIVRVAVRIITRARVHASLECVDVHAEQVVALVPGPAVSGKSRRIDS